MTICAPVVHRQQFIGRAAMKRGPENLPNRRARTSRCGDALSALKLLTWYEAGRATKVFHQDGTEGNYFQELRNGPAF